MANDDMMAEVVFQLREGRAALERIAAALIARPQTSGAHDGTREAQEVADDVRIEAALAFLTDMAGVEGAHHLRWVIDQAVQILTGPDYKRWIFNFQGEHGHEWQVGVAP